MLTLYVDDVHSHWAAEAFFSQQEKIKYVPLPNIRSQLLVICPCISETIQYKVFGHTALKHNGSLSQLNIMVDGPQFGGSKVFLKIAIPSIQMHLSADIPNM